MTLKAVVENLDDIPETLHAEYVEKDGKFYLDLDSSIKTHTSVVPLSNSLQTLKNEKAGLKTKLDEANAKLEAIPEGFDSATYAEAMEAFESLKKDPNYKGGPKNDAQLQQMRDQYDSRIRNLESAHTTKVLELETKLQQKDAKIKSDHANRELTTALNEAGVDKKYAKAAHAMLRPTVTVEDSTGELRAVVETDMGEVSVTEYVQNWAKSDDGKPFVTPATGGGSQTPNGQRHANNPFSHDNWNVTEQSAVYREKGAEFAERLAKQAGTSVGGPRPAARQAA